MAGTSQTVAREAHFCLAWQATQILRIPEPRVALASCSTSTCAAVAPHTLKLGYNVMKGTEYFVSV
jgi:hypothetical protein